MNKILIPINFQKQSQPALDQSYNLATLLSAELVLLYVHEQTSFFASLFSQEQQNDLLARIDEKLQEIAAKVKNDTGIITSTRIETGRVYTKILEVADDIQASFIIMGTHSSPEESVQEHRIGANTSRVIRSAKCPVITIKSVSNYNGCRSILLPLDLTKETRQKVTIAIEIAQLYKASIKVVSALWSKNDSVVIGRLYQQINQVTEFIKEAGINCTSEIIEDTNSERTLVPTILSYAQAQGDIDLIVIMTQQESGVVEFFVGSHAQELIRLSEIPVLSVIPKELGFTNIFS